MIAYWQEDIVISLVLNQRIHRNCTRLNKGNRGCRNGGLIVEIERVIVSLLESDAIILLKLILSFK